MWDFIRICEYAKDQSRALCMCRWWMASASQNGLRWRLRHPHLHSVLYLLIYLFIYFWVPALFDTSRVYRWWLRRLVPIYPTRFPHACTHTSMKQGFIKWLSGNLGVFTKAFFALEWCWWWCCLWLIYHCIHCSINFIRQGIRKGGNWLFIEQRFNLWSIRKCWQWEGGRHSFEWNLAGCFLSRGGWRASFQRETHLFTLLCCWGGRW